MPALPMILLSVNNLSATFLQANAVYLRSVKKGDVFFPLLQTRALVRLLLPCP
jgi:hypothetical protein